MIQLEPIGFVRSSRHEPIDDDWDRVEASIELADGFHADALVGLDEYSHAEILFYFNRVADAAIERRTRHPRGNVQWPRVGIFSLRSKDRPNRLGATIVEIRGVQGRALHVAGLDAIDGTPVLDIKPVLAEFLPRTPVRQPAWTHELMRDYWTSADEP